ncbi:MAG: hypothetical protein JEY96_01760 [Bacteroidales bacterium]|nr:hypothetical protein [Bacteroidales bacterium]
MGVRFKIHPDIGLLVVKSGSGEITHEELYKFGKIIRRRADFPDIFYTLIDLRGAIISFEEKVINDFLKLVEDYKNVDNQKAIVYIIDKPSSTAIIHVFIDKVRLNRSYCSTDKKAYDLLGLGISLQEFQELIDI